MAGQRCVLKRDHHCVFINNCLGHQNHTNFMAFLISAIIGCAQAAVIIFCTLNRALNPVNRNSLKSKNLLLLTLFVSADFLLL